MNIYLASSPVFRALFLGKLGCTEEPYGRRSTYLTGCPPGLTPSYDIDYEGMWETTATTKEELFEYGVCPYPYPKCPFLMFIGLILDHTALRCSSERARPI